MDVPKWIVDKVQPRLDAGVPRILAVEGPDDVKIYATWLERLAVPTGQPFSSQVDLVDAGSKRTLLKGLRWLRDYGGDPQTVFGLADRDEWEPATIQAMTQELPRLRVNEKRHCLESYFSDPEETIATLVHKDAGKYRQHVPDFQRAISRERKDWVCHWCLWVTLQRVAVQLSQDGEFPDVFHGQHPLPSDNTIKQRLRAWSAVIDTKTVFTQFNTLRSASLRLPHKRQFRERVYAKDFYPQVVRPQLMKVDGAIKADDWMISLAEWSPEVPEDIRTILEPLVLP